MELIEKLEGISKESKELLEQFVEDHGLMCAVESSFYARASIAINEAIKALQPPPGFEEWMNARLVDADNQFPDCISSEMDGANAGYKEAIKDAAQYFATLSTYDSEHMWLCRLSLLMKWLKLGLVRGMVVIQEKSTKPCSKPPSRGIHED